MSDSYLRHFALIDCCLFCFLNIVCSCVCCFSFLTDTYSSAESSKPRSTHRAYVLNELKEARKALAQKDEELQRLEARLPKIELQQEGVVHSLHERQPSPRHSSKASASAHGSRDDHRRRRHHPHSNERNQHRDQRPHQESKSQVPFVKVPSFNGDSFNGEFLKHRTLIQF